MHPKGIHAIKESSESPTESGLSLNIAYPKPLAETPFHYRHENCALCFSIAEGHGGAIPWEYMCYFMLQFSATEMDSRFM